MKAKDILSHIVGDNKEIIKRQQEAKYQNDMSIVLINWMIEKECLVEARIFDIKTPFEIGQKSLVYFTKMSNEQKNELIRQKNLIRKKEGN